jgi:hypothetical protein
VIKNEAYRMQQRNHTCMAVEEYHVARKEKRVHEKWKKEYKECELNWNISGT